MTPPVGTFLAKVGEGAIRLPPPLLKYCESEGWDLFRIVPRDHDRLTLEPVLSGASDPVDGFCSSLTDDGKLWIPAELRDYVSLLEQNVMMRVENGGIGIYLRKLFDTLGFRP